MERTKFQTMYSDVQKFNFIYFFTKEYDIYFDFPLCLVLGNITWSIPGKSSNIRFIIGKFKISPMTPPQVLWGILGCVDGVQVGQGETSIICWYAPYWI